MNNCLERKRLLLGGEKRYWCKLVSRGADLYILKYVLERAANVGSLNLTAGTVTYGFYWLNRPYTLYKWFSPEGEEIANYFNIADSVVFSADEISWRDLLLDILILANGQIEVLDETELQHLSNPEMRERIEAAKKSVLRTHQSVVRATTAKLREVSALNDRKGEVNR